MRAKEFINKDTLVRINNVDEDMSVPQINKAEQVASSIWAGVKVDVKFSQHFKERLNDPRNPTPITYDELVDIFAKEYERYRMAIKSLPMKSGTENRGQVEAEAVLKDAATKLNIPFVMKVNKNPDSNGIHHGTIIGKTNMKKDKFQTPNPVYTVNESKLLDRR